MSGIKNKISSLKLKLRSFLRFKSIVPLLGNITWVWPKYRIPGTSNLDVLENAEHKNPFLSKEPYSMKLIKLLHTVAERLSLQNPFTLVRLGDSELFFLSGRMIGNIVKRSFLCDDISKYDLNQFHDSLNKIDYICEHNLLYMKSIAPKKIRYTKNFDFDTVYAAMANRLLLYILKPYKIGLIGAKEKIEIIKKLAGYREYKDYIGGIDFMEYISVPQLGASKDPDYTCQMIEKQIKNKCDIYLVGMSVAKIMLLPMLKHKYNKSFLDIGIGIDALAGVVPNTKAYFGNWINYRLKNYDYSNVNFFQYQTGVKKKVQLIRWL